MEFDNTHELYKNKIINQNEMFCFKLFCKGSLAVICHLTECRIDLSDLPLYKGLYKVEKDQLLVKARYSKE